MHPALPCRGNFIAAVLSLGFVSQLRSPVLRPNRFKVEIQKFK